MLNKNEKTGGGREYQGEAKESSRQTLFSLTQKRIESVLVSVNVVRLPQRLCSSLFQNCETSAAEVVPTVVTSHATLVLYILFVL